MTSHKQKEFLSAIPACPSTLYKNMGFKKLCSEDKVKWPSPFVYGQNGEDKLILFATVVDGGKATKSHFRVGHSKTAGQQSDAALCNS